MSASISRSRERFRGLLSPIYSVNIPTVTFPFIRAVSNVHTVVVLYIVQYNSTICTKILDVCVCIQKCIVVLHMENWRRKSESFRSTASCVMCSCKCVFSNVDLITFKNLNKILSRTFNSCHIPHQFVTMNYHYERTTNRCILEATTWCWHSAFPGGTAKDAGRSSPPSLSVLLPE
jgi:hypothetical protein